MKITCFFMVCVYLSSTVSTEEIKHLNRIKKVKSWEELVLKDGTSRKESNPTVESYPDAILRKLPPHVRVETSQKPKKNLSKIKFEPLQQQSYNRGHTKRPVRLKTRSVVGTSVINELTDELISNSILDVHHDHDHDHKSIHIEPVFRVSKKSNNVFGSIIDILHQLLDPHKDELGPLVGPVQVPGSGRKIYLRLVEPVDASHVMVRFVTQVPVPVIDAEAKHPVFSSPPVIDPATVLLGGHHHYGSSDAVFGSSNRHHHSIRPPRLNASLAHGKIRGSQSIKQITKLPLKNSSKDLQDSKVAGDSSPNKDETLKSSQNNQLPGVSGNSYYHFETEEEALKQVSAILGEVNATAINEAQEQQLTTHRLPLRQIAPLYPLTSMTHPDPNADTYKVPSDVLTGPSSYSSSYEQYEDANSAPDFYASSYDQHYSAPSSYATSYNQQSNVHSTPTTYNAINYQTQNEFNPYSTSYQHQNGFSSHTASYDNHNDLYSAPSSYSISYDRPPASSPPLPSTYATFHEKPNGIPTTSASHITTPYEKQKQGAQSGSNSGDALHIIDPPYFPGYPKLFENHVNRSFDPAAIHQPSRYNSHGLNNNAHGAGSPSEKIIWGKSRQQKSESELQKNLSENSSEKSYEKWQPVVFVHENAGWQEAFKTGLAFKTTTKQPPSSSSDRSRKISRNPSTSSPEKGTIDKRENGKRRGSTLRSSWCATDKKDGCEETKSTKDPASTETTYQTVHLKKTIQIAEKTQAEPTAKSISAIASNSTASFNTTEASTSDITSRSPTTSSTTSSTTTKLSSLLLDTSPVANKMIEKSLPLIQTTRRPEVNNISATTKLPPLLIDTSPVANKMIEKPLPLIQTTWRPEVNNISATTKLPPLLIDTSLLASKIIEKPLPLVQTTRRPETKNVSTTTRPPLLIDTSNLANSMIEKSQPLIQTTRSPELSTAGATKKLIEMTNKFVIKIEDKSTKQPSVNSTTKRPVSNNISRKLELPKRPMIMKKPMFIMKRTETNSASKKSLATSTTQNPTTSSTTTKRSSMKFSKFRGAHSRKPSTT